MLNHNMELHFLHDNKWLNLHNLIYIMFLLHLQRVMMLHNNHLYIIHYLL